MKIVLERQDRATTQCERCGAPLSVTMADIEDDKVFCQSSQCAGSKLDADHYRMRFAAKAMSLAALGWDGLHQLLHFSSDI